MYSTMKTEDAKALRR